MSKNNPVATHYSHGSLLAAILEGVEKLGKSPHTVSLDELGAVDEFHIGGRLATESFLDRMEIAATDHVLDVGCGLGGASRFAAHRYGCRVTGIDLTQEFVETGRELCQWVGLSDRISLDQGDATATAYSDATFDSSYMMHVGMNIADKEQLAREVYRILRPGGRFGIYDIMRINKADLTFPVPWARTSAGSRVSSPDEYRAALEAAGFRVIAERNRQDFALDFFAQLQARVASGEGPGPLGIHILMGETAAVKVRNMIENVAKNRIAPVELIAEKP